MWESIIEAAASNGLWALLFVGLLVYLLQDSKKREEKYTKTIESLSECLNTVEDIQADVKSILSKIIGTAVTKVIKKQVANNSENTNEDKTNNGIS
jgi:hypothetical protein